MWQPLLSEKVYQEKIHDIAEILSSRKNWKKATGLFNGMSGVALFLAYYDKYCLSTQFTPLIEEIIENCFADVQTNWKSASYCNGLSGLLWSVKHLIAMNSLEVDDNFSDINDVLIREMNMYADQAYFDFLHGANGIFYYLLLVADPGDQEMTETLHRHVDQLSKHSLQDGNKVYWESYIDPYEPRKVYNLSLSHGMASKIVFLSLFSRKYPKNGQALDLLNGAVAFMLSSKNPASDQYYSVYPGTVSPHNRYGNSRMGWCYGDLSHALALFFAGHTMNQPSWINEALSLIDHAAARRNLKRDSVRDAGLCHGASGIAHIFNRFYQFTGNQTYKEAAFFWYDHSIKMASFSDGLAGYKIFDSENGWQNEIDVLEGIAGIGLALLAAIDTTPSKWDEAFLILNNN